MSKEILLSVVVPCLNEADNVLNILRSLVGVMSETSHLVRYEILVVDDSSDDDTFDVARAFESDCPPNIELKVVRKMLERRGYGAVARYGLANATGKYVTFVSADGVDPIELIPAMLGLMHQGADLVQVSRNFQGADRSHIPIKYKINQFFYRLVLKTILNTKLHTDITYSFKMVNRVRVLELGMASNRFAFGSEMYLKTMLSGQRIEIIEGNQLSRVFGISKFRFLKEGFGYGYVLLRAFLHQRKVAYWF